MSYPADLYVQDESKNPYGTYKDRKSRHVVELAKQEGVTTLCLITSGNAGYSLAQFARPEGIRVVAAVDRGVREEIRARLQDVCEVIELDLNGTILKPEDLIALARKSDSESLWDVTNGYSVAYRPIIDEIVDRNPEYIICPVGSGEAYIGLYQGITNHKIATKLIGVGVSAHPSFADKLSSPWTPYKEKLDEITHKGHRIIRLTEDEVRDSYEQHKDDYVLEPSSAVVWGGLKKLGLDTSSRVIVINSGKGIF